MVDKLLVEDVELVWLDYLSATKTEVGGILGEVNRLHLTWILHGRILLKVLRPGCFR